MSALTVLGLTAGCATTCHIWGRHQHGAHERVRHGEDCQFENASVAWVWYICGPGLDERGATSPRSARLLVDDAVTVDGGG